MIAGFQLRNWYRFMNQVKSSMRQICTKLLGVTRSSIASVCSTALPRKMAWKILKVLPGYIDIKVDGLILRCYPSDNITERELVLDKSNSRNLKLAALLMDRLRPGDIFVDIGANCGLYSILAARRVGPIGRVIAIEPLRIMLERLVFNAKINGIENIETIEAAVGDANGTVTIYARPDNYGQSSLVRTIGAMTSQVRVKPLYEAVPRSVEAIAAMKVDVEGYEDRVLLPFLRVSPRQLWPNRLMIEIKSRGDWQEDCLKALRMHGYETVWSDQIDAILELR